MKKASNPDQKMLCTDLDGTFIGDDSAMYQLLDIVDKHNILLVYSTGRHLGSVTQFTQEKGIRTADACILMVGTEVYFAHHGEFIRDNNWSQIIAQGWARDKITQLLADIKELTQQGEEWQTEFKVSYFLRENPTQVLQEINKRMPPAQLKAHIIYSADQFLDFLPPLAGKSQAAEYVAGKLGVRIEKVIVCGDSGNDLDMFNSGFKGIIVGNAHAELKSFKGENAYHAIGEYSAGIIEGLRHFNFI